MVRGGQEGPRERRMDTWRHREVQGGQKGTGRNRETCTVAVVVAVAVADNRHALGPAARVHDDADLIVFWLGIVELVLVVVQQ